MAKNLIQKDVEQIVPLTLARAGYEMRQIEAEKSCMWLYVFGNDIQIQQVCYR
jgi:hypothetical protein